MTNPLYLSGTSYGRTLVSKSQDSVQRLSSELSSGGESGTYGTVKDTKLFLDLQGMLNRLDSYKTNAEYSKEKVSEAVDKIGRMRDLATTMQKDISESKSSGLPNQENFRQRVQDMFGQVRSLLNSQFNGSFLFAGTAKTTEPVIDLKTLPGIATGSGPDTSYYVGNTDAIGFQVDDNLFIEMTPNASNPGFEKFIRSLRLCSDAVMNPPDLERLGQANDLCLEAVSDMISMEANLGSVVQKIEKSMESVQERESPLMKNLQAIGYESTTEMMHAYFQEKTNLTIAEEITIQLIKKLDEFVKSLPF